MCGRFALGVPADEIRAGIVHHFPRMLNNPQAAARRAQQGQAGRERQRQDRERRRGRGAGGSGAGRRVVAPEAAQPDDDEEPLEWPASDEEAHNAQLAPQGGDEDHAIAARLQWENEERFRQGNFNVAPRSNGVVLRLRPSQADGSDLRLRGGGEGGEVVEVSREEVKNPFDVGNQELVIETMQWGLIPHWSKHPPSGPLNTINARSENLTDNAGGMWQSLKGPKRCLVVVQGYYEWQKKGTVKIPHFTKLPPTKDSIPHLMLLAGLYDTVKYIDAPASDPPHKTFTILTTTPCKSLQWLHDRMPVILEREEECVRWLDCRDGWTPEVAKLLRPYDGEVECYPVPTEVGKIGNNSPSFVIPVKERKDGIANFFKKQTAEGVPTKTEDSSSKGKHAADEKLTPSKRQLSDEKDKEVAHVDKKPKTDRAKQVHSPVPSSKLDVEIKAEKTGGTSTIREKDSPPTKREEQEFEIGIGDDSNAPNPTTPKSVKGKGKKISASPEVAIVSPRQTRSSARQATTKQEHTPTPGTTKTTKRKRPSSEVKSEDEDEIQAISSPDSVKRTKRGSATGPTKASSKGGQAETKVNKSEPRSRKTKGATTQGGTGEEGLESTHQTSLDGFLKHEE